MMGGGSTRCFRSLKRNSIGQSLFKLASKKKKKKDQRPKCRVILTVNAFVKLRCNCVFQLRKDMQTSDIRDNTSSIGRKEGETERAKASLVLALSKLIWSVE